MIVSVVLFLGYIILLFELFDSYVETNINDLLTKDNNLVTYA